MRYILTRNIKRTIKLADINSIAQEIYKKKASKPGFEIFPISF